MSKIINKTTELTVNPSGYTGNSGSVSNYTNGYNSTANTSSYVTFTSNKSTTANYVYFTFDVSAIPSTATINSVACIANIRKNRTSTSLNTIIQLYSGTTAKGSSTSITTATAGTITTISDTGTWTRSELNDLRLYINSTATSTRQTYYSYFYGADITINYTYEDTAYTINTTIIKGTMNTDNPIDVFQGDSTTLKFVNNDSDNYVFKKMTVDGVSVIPTFVDTLPGVTSITMTPSTNMSVYSGYPITNIVDEDTSTWFWSLETLAVGLYVMVTLSDKVYLNSVTTIATGSDTDYPQSNCELLVSINGEDWTSILAYADGEQTLTITVNQSCLYIRWYLTGSADYWFVINEITLNYSAEDIPAHYEYTMNNLSEDHEVLIIFGFSGPLLYLKDSSGWKLVTNVYKKDLTGWNVISESSLQTLVNGKKLIKKN